MVTQRFDMLFRRLVAAFTLHQRAPREPERVQELAAKRRDLDLARSAIATERASLNPIAPTEPPRKTQVSEDDVARLRVFGAGFQQS